MRIKSSLLFIFSSVNLLLGQTMISGEVSGLWTVDYQPYVLTGDALLPTGDTLVIEPGVTVDLGGDFELRVQGVLLADGSRWQHGGSLFGAGGTLVLTANHFSGLTAGIKIYGGQARIQNCFVDSTSETGITLNGTDSSFVLNTSVTNSGDYGIKVRATEDVVIMGNHLSRNSQNDLNHPALFFDSASPLSISDNVIENNRAQGIGVWSLSETAAPHLFRNIIRGNYTGITLVNSPARIEENVIVANFVQGNFNSGAGIYAGYENSQPIVMSNYIAGNYYGVSNINNAACNLGDMVNDFPEDDGLNIFYDNTFNGTTWNIWNETSNQLMAQNNYWPGLELRDVDNTLWDDEEGGSEVLYEPIYAPPLPPVSDLNNDGLINVLDVVQIVDVITQSGCPSGLSFYLSDANNDYQVNVADVVMVVELIVSD